MQALTNPLHRDLLANGADIVRANAESKAERRAIDAAIAVMSDDGGGLGISHAGFAMTSLPHRKVPKGTTLWERRNGAMTLLVEPGRLPGGGYADIPAGAHARMILLYLQTMAVRTRSRRVELGRSMNAWLSRMGLTIGGKTYRMVNEQVQALSAARLTFLWKVREADARLNGSFIDRSVLFGDDPDQPAIWNDEVTLNEHFYQSLIDHSVPLLESALRQLTSSSMAIDVYIWLAYRLHALREQTLVPWPALHDQFGQGYTRVRDFRAHFVDVLKLSLAVYPGADVDLTRDGLILRRSPPPIAAREVSRLG